MLLEGLETLSLLASEGTMAKVASRLYISQSAVSKRIAQLEQRLGKKLIEPEGRQIRLTPQAKELLERVAPSLAEMKGVLADSQDLADQSPLPIACSETLLAGYLAHFMRDYLERNPHLALSTHHTPVILARVRSGDALLGICAGRLRPAMASAPTCCLRSPSIWWARRSRACHQPTQKAGARYLTMDLENPSNRYLREPLADLGLEPAMELDSYLALIELAKAGIGPVLLPAGLLGLVGEQGRWPAHCPDWAAPCIWSTDQTASSASALPGW